MFLLSAQSNFYIILSSYVEGYVKKNSNLNFMILVSSQVSKMWKCFWKIYFEASFQIIFRKKIISYSLLLFNFRIVFNMVWKNQENYESWLVEFWVGRLLKMQKLSTNSFSFAFLSCCFGFSNYFEILFFSSTMPRRVSTSGTLFL